MEIQESSIKDLVMKVKEELFSPVDHLSSFVSPSAYDTAWMAMIPHPQRPDHPLFKGCLDWVLHNQKSGGFWGETDSQHFPTIDCLSATLACIVALKKWSVGTIAIQKGLAFIHANTEKLLKEQNGSFPRWFAIVFPGMVELAQTIGLEIDFSEGSTVLVEDIFFERLRIVERDASRCQHNYPILIAYLEALPETHNVNHDELLKHQSEDGSVFQSPSATAYAFMATRNNKFLAYLESIVQRCGNGVPPIYPMDEDLIKICLVDRIERLGLAEHFAEEIKIVLAHIFRNYISEAARNMGEYVVPLQIYKDSLAFRLLRLHGYLVSPWKFCWFLHHEDIMVHMEENYEYFLSAMYNVYRASDVMFIGENHLELARKFSKMILERGTILINTKDSVVDMANLQDQIKHEISLPWLARLDHLEHRKCIEGNETSGLWMGKASFYRLTCISNATLLQLAIENYTLRQSIYRKELKELERWSKDLGLCDMGFAREKTTYCYFAVAATLSLPSLSDVRMAVVKGAILITVADDFFDMEGSLNELKILTSAIQRWERKGLNGHSKVIFDAIEDLVNDISGKYHDQQGWDIKIYLQDIWHQTFLAWLKEAEWSRNRSMPSIEEYHQVAVTSIAVHTIVLPASFLMSPPPPKHIIECPQSEIITNLLMILTRLLNDIQTYQREQEEGKLNLVLLYIKENPELSIEDSIALMRKTLDEKKKEFLEHILVDGMSNNMPETCKQLHLYCLKAFQMFYNSRNAFDSPTDLLPDIQKAIYDPLKVIKFPITSGLRNKNSTINGQFGRSFQHPTRKSFKPNGRISVTSGKGWHGGKKCVAQHNMGVLSTVTRKLNCMLYF